MAHARPAFADDGAWNGRILLPLLLHAAQDAMRDGGPRHDDTQEAAADQDRRQAALAKEVAAIVHARPDGAGASLRWGGWLFRSVMSRTKGEPSPFPNDARGRARSDWHLVEALQEDDRAERWSLVALGDLPAEDVMCVEAMRVLAAREHGLPVPGLDLLHALPARRAGSLSRRHRRRADAQAARSLHDLR